MRLEQRYQGADVIPQLLQQVGPGGRLITLEGHEHRGQPLMVTEFGGIAFSDDRDDGTWGYARAESAEELAERYTALVSTLHRLPLLAGFCYTQFADTYQEANGLLYADRRPKIPIDVVAAATRGRTDARAQGIGMSG